MLKVYGVALSPFVRKVMLALEYKGLDYDNEPTMPGDDDAAFRSISPLGKIPVLVHDDFSIPDTSVICRYIDRISPDKPLYPADPKEEARACWLEELADSKLIEACAGLFQQKFLNPNLNGIPADDAIVANILDNQLPSLLSYLESETSGEGPLVGDAISIADIAVLTCFLQARYGDFEVDGSQYPKLRAYLDDAMGHEVVADRMQQEAEVLKALTGQ